jgi:hypothetical protein
MRTYPVVAWMIWRDARGSHIPAQTHEIGAPGRLGRVLYWTGVVLGVLLGLGFATLAWTPADPRPAAIGAAVGFIGPYLAGKVARYVLVGE